MAEVIKNIEGRNAILLKLKDELRPLFGHNCFILVHGCTVAVADDVFNRGLGVARPQLSYTTDSYLFKGFQDFELQPDGSFLELLNLRNHHHQAVVFILLPDCGPEINAHGYMDGLLQRPEGEKQQYFRNKALSFVLPPKFIAGYLDVKNLKFVDNPNFNSEIANIRQITTAHAEKSLED